MSKKQETLIAFPEVAVATRRDKTGEQERWTVKGGLAQRGEAWTNFAEHTIQVPLVNDETANVVRGHELVHSHISPMEPEALEAWAENEGISPEVIMSAEEFRVNQVLKSIGYNTDYLIDGSEKQSGIRLGKDKTDHARDLAVTMGASIVGTKGFRHFLSGIRSQNPELALELREMEKAMLKITRRQVPSWLGDTRPMPVHVTEKDGSFRPIGNVPIGFDNFIPKIAQVINDYLSANVSDWLEGSGGLPGDPKDKGEFARLRLDENPRLDVQVKGQLFRKKRPRETGKRIAYPSRLLTDPQKRIFAQKPKNSGGIVILDLSGSMSLSMAQIEAMVEACPGALVVGYSNNRHRQRDPNAWILAKRGKRVANLRHVGAGQGNGVDGPALEYALANRRGSEPIIWVCDGVVTTKDDSYSSRLARYCYELVKRHRIVMVDNPEDAVKYLQNPRGPKPKYQGHHNYGVARLFATNGETDR